MHAFRLAIAPTLFRGSNRLGHRVLIFRRVSDT